MNPTCCETHEEHWSEALDADPHYHHWLEEKSMHASDESHLEWHEDDSHLAEEDDMAGEDDAQRMAQWDLDTLAAMTADEADKALYEAVQDEAYREWVSEMESYEELVRERPWMVKWFEDEEFIDALVEQHEQSLAGYRS